MVSDLAHREPVAKGHEPTPAPIGPVTSWLSRRVLVGLAWFLGSLAVVLFVLYPTLQATVDQVVSLWELTADNAPMWFLLAMGIQVVGADLGPMVAAGVTRARFASASALVLLGAAVLLAFVAPAGYALEGWYARSFGWEPTLRFGHLFHSSAQPLLVMGEYLLMGLVFAYSGLLAGITYYRFRPLFATPLLLLTVIAPIGLAGELVGTSDNGLVDLSSLALGIRWLLLLVLVVVLFALVRWLMPRTRLKPKST